MKSLKYILVLFIISLAGCEHDVIEDRKNYLVEFSVKHEDDEPIASISRADIREDEFDITIDSIGILGYLVDEGDSWVGSTSAPEFINNDFISYKSSSYHWALNNPKYWPENTTPSMRVFAYFPYDSNIKFNYTSGYPSFIYAMSNYGHLQKDFMIANSDDLYDKYSEFIPLNFSHQLACVNFSVTMTGDRILMQSIYSPAKPFYTATGTFTEAGFEWSNMTNPKAMYSSTDGTYYLENDERYVEQAPRLPVDSQYSMLLFPQTLEAGTEFQLVYKNADNQYDGKYQPSQTVAVTLNEDVVLEKGGTYNIPFTIENGAFFEDYHWVPFSFEATGNAPFNGWKKNRCYITAYGKVQNNAGDKDGEINNVLYLNNGSSHFDGYSNSTKVLVNTKYPGEQIYQSTITTDIDDFETNGDLIKLDAATKQPSLNGGLLWGKSGAISPENDTTPESINIAMSQKMCKVTAEITMRGTDYVFANSNGSTSSSQYKSIKLKNTNSKATFDMSNGTFSNYEVADILEPAEVTASGNVLSVTFYTFAQTLSNPIVEVTTNDDEVYSFAPFTSSTTWAVGGSYTYNEVFIHSLIGRYYFNNGVVTADHTSQDVDATPTKTTGIGGIVCKLNNFFTPSSGASRVIAVVETYQEFMASRGGVSLFGSSDSYSDGMANTKYQIGHIEYDHMRCSKWVDNINYNQKRIASTKSSGNYSSGKVNIWYNPAINEVRALYGVDKDIYNIINTAIYKLPAIKPYTDSTKNINEPIENGSYWSSTEDSLVDLFWNGLRFSFYDNSTERKNVEDKYNFRPMMFVNIPSTWND